MKLKIKAPPEWGITPIPENLRILGIFDYFVLWFSLGVGLLVFQAGTFLVPGLSLFEALIASLIGSIIGSLFLSLAGVIGSRYGIPTMVSLRATFGRVGTYLPTVLNVIQLVGWTAFEFMVMGNAAAAISGNFLGEFTTVFWIIIVAIWCWLMAVFGPLAIIRQYLEKISVWLVLISTIWISAVIFSSPNVFQQLWVKGENTIPFLYALDLVIAMPISWMPLASDYNRFAIKPSKSFLGTFLGYTVANTWFYGLGSALVIATGHSDVVKAISSIFFGFLALLFILVDETDNAFADIYSTAVSVQNIFPKLKQWKTSTIVTIIGIVLAAIVPLAEYEYFLLMIGAFFVPLFGVLISDYFVVIRGHYEVDDFYEKAKLIRLDAIVSWVIGAIVYFLIVSFIPEIGSSLPSLLSAILIHYLLAKLTGGR